MPEEVTPVDSGAGVDSPTDATATPAPEKDYKAENEKLQKENQAYREKYQPYERLYGQNSEIQQFHEAAENYASGNMTEVQEWLFENTAAALGVTAEELVAKFEEVSEEDKPLTKKEVKDMLAAEREAQQQTAQQIQVSAIQSHAESLGYEPGSWEYESLLALAMRKHGNDLDAAHEEFSKLGNKDEIIQSFVEEQKAKTRGSLKSNSGQAPASDRKISSWKDADAAVDEYLSHIQ